VTKSNRVYAVSSDIISLMLGLIADVGCYLLSLMLCLPLMSALVAVMSALIADAGSYR
jgi:hypothetical protein